MTIRDRGDDGAGLIGSAVGVMVFLLLLLLAVQVCFVLYVSSTVTAAVWDAVRIASGSDAAVDRATAEDNGEDHLRNLLGRYDDRVTTNWRWSDDDVALTVAVDHPGFLPRAVRRPMGLERFERTVSVRIERAR